MDLPRRRWRGLAAATVMAAALMVPASSALASDHMSTEFEPTEANGATVPVTVDELQLLVDELGIANETLREETATLQRSVDSLTLERDRLQDSLGHFRDQYDNLEADRKLVLELRKGLPDTRPEAEAHLERIRAYALDANASRLGRLVDRVDAAAPAFLDWRFTQYGSTQEATEAYISTGANAFDSSMNELRDEVLMSVANRLDGLLTVLDRLR